MYWFGFPAIMKGWIDRVLTKGYAYSERTRYSQGVFKVTLASSNYCTSGEIQTLLHTQDKKAILSFTTGSQELMFGSNGINGDMNVTLWPIQVLCHEATNKVSINKGANGLISSRMASWTTVASRFCPLRFSGHHLMLQQSCEPACWRTGVCDCKASWVKSPCPSLLSTALTRRRAMCWSLRCLRNKLVLNLGLQWESILTSACL